METYYQDQLAEYCTDFGYKAKPTDKLCAMIMDAGLDIGWRPGMDYRVIRKTTGCEGRLALHYFRSRHHRYEDCHWKFKGQSGQGVDLLDTTGTLLKCGALSIDKRSSDSFIWVSKASASNAEGGQ